METLSYLTTLEKENKILKICQSELLTNKNAVNAIKKRFNMLPMVKLNNKDEVEYPSICKLINNLIIFRGKLRVIKYSIRDELR
jgi:hypothetical protein